jgi:hypothetical protein
MNDPKNHRTEPAWQASPELRAKVEEYEDRETPIIPRIPLMPEPATAIYCCESRSVNAVKWEHNHPLVSGLDQISKQDSSCEQCGWSTQDHGYLETEVQGNIVCPGDWIVEINGELYPIQEEIFYALFKPTT